MFYPLSRGENSESSTNFEPGPADRKCKAMPGKGPSKKKVKQVGCGATKNGIYCA